MLSGGSYTTIDVPGSTSPWPTTITTPDRSWEFYQDGDGGGPHGFVLSGGRYTTIDVPGSIWTYARGINDAGQIVGSYFDARGTHGFLATSVVAEP